MKRVFVTIALLTAAACATAPRGGGSGALSISITPDPVVAQQVRGNVYEFPLDVIVRETGGRKVEIKRVSADVFALGSLKVASEAYDAAQIRAMGYPTEVPANGELRYHFAQRHEVPDERLFIGVRAELRVEAVDDGGTALTATTKVSITK